MSDIEATKAILRDAFDRVAEQVSRVTDGLAEEDATWRPDEHANSIAWLLWHLSRVQDDHVGGLSGVEQVWTSGGWYRKFGLPFDEAAHGYGHTSEEVAQVRTPPAELAGYHAAVNTATLNYLDALTEQELDRVVDTNWDPPVTTAARLVSVINDCTDHVGQAEYLRGLAERR